MPYSTDILTERITVLNRKKATVGAYGLDSGGAEWEEVAKGLHASVTWNKGARALNNGSVDAYTVKLVRMRWTNQISMRSRIVYEENTYQILPETFNPNRRDRTLQFLMQLIVN